MTETRIFDIFDRFIKYPDTIGKMFFAEKKDNKWIKYNTEQYREISNFVSYGLLAMELKKGDKVITISNNRPQWNFMDMGIAQIGAVHVPVYNTLSNKEFEYILQHSDAKMVVVGNENLYKKIKPIADKLEVIKEIYTFDEVENAKNWQEIVELGKKSEVYFKKELVEIKKNISEEELLTIIYTSGTTGTPKGVMLSHKNLMSNSIYGAKRIHIDHTHQVLSFLPLSHIFEHMTSYIYQYVGTSVYYAENVGTIAQNINELQVDGFITVPRLLESIYEKIILKAKNLSPIKRRILLWSIELGKQYKPFDNSWFYKQKLKIADKLVFSKWRDVLSNKICFIGCAGSALRESLGRLFWAAGLPVFEGYGLSETSPIVSVNYNKAGKIALGSVGTVLEGVTVELSDENEVLVKGANVMLGYYKNPKLTAEVIDKRGFFHTGDIGQFTEEGYLKITDRKKEIFKMANGKYIAPQVIENKLKESIMIGNSIVVGENQKFAGVLISPNFLNLKHWCEKQKIKFQNNKDLIDKPKVKEFFQKEINLINKSLGSFEQIRQFRLVGEEWSTQTGELSPTLKLKRKIIHQKYLSLIEKMFYSKKLASIK